MDSIYLRDIELSARIGVFDWEQQIDQKLILSLTLEVDARAAGASDALADAVDYGAVLQTVQTLVSETRVHLIETLATRIADTVLGHFPLVQALTVDLAKVFIFPAVPRIGVVIRRARDA